jgi:excinuclease UvrABC ATPase subunit
MQMIRLRDLGHTIVVVEHHMGFLQSADWLIEIGPEAAGAGGNIVYQGPPAGLKDVPESRTAPYLYS